MADPSAAELSGLTAVVTGSSSGIGRAIALELAAAGAACLVHARQSLNEAQEVSAEIQSRGAASTVVMADLSESAAHERLVQEAWQWRGAVDIWVNNAGADTLTGEAVHWKFERKLEELLRIDVVAAMRLARLVGKRMKERGAGSIVHIGWDQAETGQGGDSGELFAAAKGAVMAFSKSLARSLAPTVRVNCVAPGWIKTAWGAGASQYWQDRARRESLLDRWGTPEDVARAVRFVVSPAASFITGQTIAVNGGLKLS